MKRATRLIPVKKIMDDAERRAMERSAAAERVLSSGEQKLQDLVSYRGDYEQGLVRRAGLGIGARDLVDYHAFMHRLDLAIKQQTQIVERLRMDRDAQQRLWQQAAQRAKSMTHVIEQWQLLEQQKAAKREQREFDERAQRKPVVRYE